MMHRIRLAISRACIWVMAVGPMWIAAFIILCLFALFGSEDLGR